MAIVKTAISIQRSLFEQAEALAKEMGLSRSAVFVLALEEFILRRQNQRLLREINAAYDANPDPAEQTRLEKAEKAQRKLVEGEW
jgi:metal-responsive CopG/Arc/MetJ family transcriptional regulator